MDPELKDKIIAHFDELSLLDFLGLDIADLVDRLEEDIDEKRVELEQQVS